MRRLGLVVGGLLLGTFLIGLSWKSTSAKTPASAQQSIAYYVDPMHPGYRSARPGIAPDCGMPLSPVYADQAKTKDAAAIQVDKATREALGIQVVAAQLSEARPTLRFVGRVVAQDNRIFSVNSGTEGFIRETWRDSIGSLVAKDQKLATCYAPDFIAAASGFIAATERVPGTVTGEGARSIQNYTDRLKNLGMSDPQIRQIAETRRLPQSIDIVSPAAGVILARNLSPGQHFTHDTTFYQIADLSRVWVEVEVYPQDLSMLHKGMPAELTLPGSGGTLRVRLSASLPQSTLTAGTSQVRLEADNPHLLLRPNQRVDVSIPVAIPSAVTIPASALIDTGTRRVVYVERDAGEFEVRSVETGRQTADRIQIQKGVQPGERVVAAGTFLVDSESRLRTAFASASVERAPAR